MCTDVLLLAIAIAVFLWIYTTKSNSKAILPRGPQGLPFLGNVHQLVGETHLTLSRWAIKYGPLFTIRIGSKTAVIVSTTTGMRKLLGKLSTSGRFNLPFELTFGDYGIAMAVGREWQEVRNFFVRSLRNCDLGQSSRLEQTIHQESQSLTKWLRDRADSLVTDIKIPFVISLQSVFWRLTTRAKDDPQQAKELALLTCTWFRQLQLFVNKTLILFPILKPIAPLFSDYRKFTKGVARFQEIVREYFYQRQKEFLENPEGAKDGDLYDIWFKEWASASDKPESSFYGKRGELHGVTSFMGLILGSAHTTATILNFIVNYLAVWPKVQEKLQEEIDDVLEDKREPRLADRSKMTYTEAFILEVLRYSSVGPLGVGHACLEDVEYEGYFLPKGTLIFGNIYHANFDKNVWGDPENFRPERFLADEGKNGDLQKQIASFLPGIRVCPGEKMSKEVLFLMTVILVQKFSFEMDPKKTVEDYILPDAGFNLTPKHVGVVVTERKIHI